MNDANQALLLGFVGMLITGVIVPLASHWISTKRREQMAADLAAVKVDVVAVKSTVASVPSALGEMRTSVAAVAVDVSLVKGDVQTVHMATNSMREQLVAAADLVGEARGIRLEKAAQRERESEQAKGALGQVQRQADLDAPGKEPGR